MGETHGPTEGLGQALGRKFLRCISLFVSAVPSAHVVTPQVHTTSPGSSPTILRKLHRHKLPASTSASSTLSPTSTVSSPLASMISRSRSCEGYSCTSHDTFVATVQPDIPFQRTKSDTDVCSTRHPPTPTPFQACSHSASDHLRGGCGCEEPVVPLMNSRQAWKVMGRRFQKASPHELVLARRPLVYKARNLNRSLLVQGSRLPALQQNPRRT
ncbi:hypothetical protein T484DRAFT_1927394 [Baffinella frigidus]|nr:hypothetical protein T484DRAFT_1927394 [Cryptophyta sp. CCMP2293]